MADESNEYISEHDIDGRIEQAQSYYDNRDPHKAFELFEILSDVPYAQYMLGDMCYTGIGTERDYIKAFDWIKKAACNGIVPAVYMLGLCYELGNGTEKNIDEARVYYKIAAEAGDDSAAKRLNRIMADNGELD